MNKAQTFEQFLSTQSPEVPFAGFVINFLLVVLLSYLLGWIYVKWGRSLSNRKMFADNFILLATTTMLVIVVVKSSLALSLGLVGALSIVRFRSAIKEPEELAYLFLNIGLGLGLGADQRVITVLAFVLIAAVIWIKHITRRREEGHNLYLTVASDKPGDVVIEDMVRAVEQHCRSLRLKRFDQNADMIEALFAVEIDDFRTLSAIKAELMQLGDSISITFLDTERAP